MQHRDFVRNGYYKVKNTQTGEIGYMRPYMIINLDNSMIKSIPCTYPKNFHEFLKNRKESRKKEFTNKHNIPEEDLNCENFDVLCTTYFIPFVILSNGHVYDVSGRKINNIISYCEENNCQWIPGTEYVISNRTLFSMHNIKMKIKLKEIMSNVDFSNVSICSGNIWNEFSKTGIKRKIFMACIVDKNKTASWYTNWKRTPEENIMSDVVSVLDYYNIVREINGKYVVWNICKNAPYANKGYEICKYDD
jgi:hypothetical protein